MIAEYKQQKCELVKQNSQEYRRYTNNGQYQKRLTIEKETALKNWSVQTYMIMQS